MQLISFSPASVPKLVPWLESIGHRDRFNQLFLGAALSPSNTPAAPTILYKFFIDENFAIFARCGVDMAFCMNPDPFSPSSADFSVNFYRPEDMGGVVTTFESILFEASMQRADELDPGEHAVEITISHVNMVGEYDALDFYRWATWDGSDYEIAGR